ncbi:MAG: 2-hydroxyhepta-2,4-diene-1,7-dioate isomerase [Anaerolineae bacterium UTCFX2]|jgi:2-keto-4-pentenoate hydratase/2-oxohepta-3-ene-1,7-dioic acid hydratase in catechol pathway|nr:fumarylacetoacetate hydrolase family protein [Anaerolineales bacterium]OQY90500.1 MAG: 2-hydroxyhepta-2,4-diene-1,7-dioate isomerase [Anaerolineae bacterium UTCFX2]
MRLIRYLKGDQPPAYGWLLDEPTGSYAGAIEGSPFEGFRRMDADTPLQSIRLLSPILPGKIIGIGRNYAAHAHEHGAEIPEIPLFFLKPPSAVIGPDEPIVLPPQSQQVEHEAELVVVIGKRGRWLSPEESLDYILGYTVGNDVTARDLQRKDEQWTRAKGFDTFCPIGPWIETDFDPADSLITCHVNGEMRQMSSTRDMIFNVRQLIAYVSSVMTLEPGDLIMTGTPAGVGPLLDGDLVEATVEGLGTLRNPVVKEGSH